MMKSFVALCLLSIILQVQGGYYIINTYTSSNNCAASGLTTTTVTQTGVCYVNSIYNYNSANNSLTINTYSSAGCSGTPTISSTLNISTTPVCSGSNSTDVQVSSQQYYVASLPSDFFNNGYIVSAPSSCSTPKDVVRATKIASGVCNSGSKVVCNGNSLTTSVYGSTDCSGSPMSTVSVPILTTCVSAGGYSTFTTCNGAGFNPSGGSSSSASSLAAGASFLILSVLALVF
eukprot:TRINITY_DN1196_c0_g1_i1.p1 TRINITY_DN1196_c0_g1~~TRINITY_DN1196_c0_g1_i1.p1  ORF type:complete len:232 (-),score=37.30 TRINITY_DN1196_c0_g1_i1:23-718(-)